MALSASGAFVAATVMLLLGIMDNFGIYEGTVDMMMKWHMFFSLSPLGIVGGMIEAAVNIKKYIRIDYYLKAQPGSAPSFFNKMARGQKRVNAAWTMSALRKPP